MVVIYKVSLFGVDPTLKMKWEMHSKRLRSKSSPVAVTEHLEKVRLILRPAFYLTSDME